MTEALSREAYQAGAGFIAETHFERIFEEFADCASAEAWDAAKGIRALEEWTADNRIGRATAALDDRLQAWESSAVITLENGERLPYQQAAIAIANEPRRERRLAIDTARRAVNREPSAMRTEKLGRERDLLGELLGLPVVAARARLSGIDLAGLAGLCRAFLDRTRDLYHDTLKDELKRELGLTPGSADRTDGAFLFRGAAYDEFFPGEALIETARGQVGEMGIDATAGGRITCDTAERERKRARAFCAPVRVPEEVYLVTRPHGGYVDYRAFWHELGHALHFANASRDLRFEQRWLGDNSVTESYAMLFEHQTMAPAWLRRYAAMSGEPLRAFTRAQGFALLAILRRYAAKLEYEIGLHAAPSFAAAAPHYAELLTEATGFRYSEDDALSDLDDGFYSARYLRAWLLEAALRGQLIERFDVDWFRNPRCGPAVLDLLVQGQREDATGVARQIGVSLDFTPLIRQCEEALK
jgi:hypothetical protein